MAITQSVPQGSTGTVSQFKQQILQALFHDLSATDGLTAGTTQTIAGGTSLPYQLNRFTSVGSASDAATLPTAIAGRWRVVMNADAANTLQIFPANSTDVINALTGGSSITLAANKVMAFFCAVNGVWSTLLTA